MVDIFVQLGQRLCLIGVMLYVALGGTDANDTVRALTVFSFLGIHVIDSAITARRT